MKIKLACADFTFPILPHDQVLQLIPMLGIKGVDIGLFEDRSHLQPSSEFASARRAARGARRLKRQLDNNGLVAADLFLQLALDYESRALNHPRSAIRRKARDAFQHTLDYAAECKARHITALPGVHFNGESRRDSTARAAEARAYRIVFAIEPHIDSFATTPKRTLDLLRDHLRSLE